MLAAGQCVSFLTCCPAACHPLCRTLPRPLLLLSLPSSPAASSASWPSASSCACSWARPRAGWPLSSSRCAGLGWEHSTHREGGLQAAAARRQSQRCDGGRSSPPRCCLFPQVYPRTFLGEASMYDQHWWQLLVRGWEAAVYNSGARALPALLARAVHAAALCCALLYLLIFHLLLLTSPTNPSELQSWTWSRWACPSSLAPRWASSRAAGGSRACARGGGDASSRGGTSTRGAFSGWPRPKGGETWTSRRRRKMTFR